MQREVGEAGKAARSQCRSDYKGRREGGSEVREKHQSISQEWACPSAPNRAIDWEQPVAGMASAWMQGCISERGSWDPQSVMLIPMAATQHSNIYMSEATFLEIQPAESLVHK